MQSVTDIQEITFEAPGFAPGKASVFYASIPVGSPPEQSPKGINFGGEDEKHRLASILWNHLAARKIPIWMGNGSQDENVFPVRVERGLLGRPRLLWGDEPGPGISFTRSGDHVWGALFEGESDIGIDVTQSLEFRGDYPLHRILHPQEIDHALERTGNDLEGASALLWSIKEAVVKAMGCGFHLVDPRQIMVYPVDGSPLREKNAHAFSVRLLENAARRFPVFKDRFLQIRSLCQGKMWLSIALFHGRNPRSREQRPFNTQNPWRQGGDE